MKKPDFNKPSSLHKKEYYFCSMTKINHWAIFSSGLSIKSSSIQNILNGLTNELLREFEGKNGALFSNNTLEQFIKEEAIHDDFTLSKTQNRSIRTFSSGEQRKALLNYLISTKPDYLVLENAFDMLDVESQQNLMDRLTELSFKIPIIQMVKRKDNLLPFINHAVLIENKKISFAGTIGEFLNNFKTNNSFTLNGTLPEKIEKSRELKNPLVNFKNVSVKFGEKCILENINWTINNGDFWQLTGPNGSGKTTLLTMITGDNPKAYGQDLTLFGKKRGSGESIWDIKKNIGYVTPSMTTLFRGWNSIEKMVISGFVDSIGLYQKPTEMQKRLAGEWIKLIGLEEIKHSRFYTLSEGQQCMVLIARAMIKHPPLLILDEPAHGLDDYNATILTALINKISEEGQTTIIYVSHRKEPGLKPGNIYELVAGDCGSMGRIVQKL